MTKDEALKMAIRIMQAFDNEIPTNSTKEAINACKEALEQPTVAELNNEYLRDTNVIGLEQSAQEPYGWYDNHDIHTEKQSDESIALYTHPHQWQGLTDNEKLASIRKWAENNTMRGQELIGLCDAIEQALKEKNHG